MNERYVLKIVLALLILLISAPSCKQQRSKCSHYLSQKEHSELYKKRMEKDAAINLKKRQKEAAKSGNRR